MKKKRRARLFRPALCTLALAVSLSASGCGLINGTMNGVQSVEGSRIYVIGQGKGIEFWDHVKQGAMEAAEELGYEVIFKAEGDITDTDAQRKLIREAINDDADTIVIAPNDPDALNNELNEAVKAGIEVITIDSDTNFVGRRAYVGTINASSGAMAARHAADFFTNYYNDKVVIVAESEAAMSSQDRLSGFIPALIGTVKSRAAAALAEQMQSEAMAELENSDLPAVVLNPARSSAAVAAASGAPPDALAKAVAGAVFANAKNANIDPEIAAKAAKLATDANGGNGDLAYSETIEMLTGEKPAETKEENTPTYNDSEDVKAQVEAAAQAAAKGAAANGAPPAAIADAATKAAAETAIKLGAGPGTAAKAAGVAAGQNGGDSIAASSAAAELVAQASGDTSGGDQNANAGQEGAQQGGAPEGGADAADIPEELAQAANIAAQTAAGNGAPPVAISQAAANAAATTAVSLGADPSVAAQAAAQAAAANGGDPSAAATAAAEATAEAMGGDAPQGGAPEGGAPEGGNEETDKPAETGTPSTIQGGGSAVDAISPVQQILNCKGDSELAKSQVLQLLKNDTEHKIKVIFTTGERSTIGACEAVAEADLVGKVAIIGYNTNETELTYLKNGTLSGLVVQNPYNMGYLGIYYAGRILAGENVSPMVDTGSTYVTLQTLNSDEVRLMLDPVEFTKK